MVEPSFSLSELNRQVKNVIRNALPEPCWLRAETSDVRVNQNGHCYLEFVEKDEAGHSIIAKARGMIWSSTYRMLSPFFEQETGQRFASGLSVLVRVTVDFHELYGFSLTVVDIDPSFTLGEIARNRQRVLRQLEEDGVLSLNKELGLPELANRIAVISSPSAAGYEDFRNQLENNPGGFIFYTKLFPAVMQGERSEESIIAALEKIFLYREWFHAVAIIRGGGAASDLSCFDSYNLAYNVAQFPLPVLSGIGHERDMTVLDIVAHTRGKTPTAVAEIFIAHLAKTAMELNELQERLASQIELLLFEEKSNLLSLSNRLVHHSSLFLQKEVASVQKIAAEIRYRFQQAFQKEVVGLQETMITLRHLIRRLLNEESNRMIQYIRNLRQSLLKGFQEECHFVENMEQFVRMVSPVNILKRGYTLTLKGGKIITSSKGLHKDEVIETRFRDGDVISLVQYYKNKSLNNGEN